MCFTIVIPLFCLGIIVVGTRLEVETGITVGTGLAAAHRCVAGTGFGLGTTAATAGTAVLKKLSITVLKIVRG